MVEQAASFPFDPASRSGGGYVGAWEARCKDVTTPAAWLKFLNRREDWERLNVAVVLSLNQDGRAVGIGFHSAHCSPSEKLTG